MPHVVAITRAPRVALPGGYRELGASVPAPLETWLGAIASSLSMTPYDLRLKVAGSPPWVVARVGSAEEASAIASRLRASECGAVQVDLASLVGRRASTVARAFVRDDGTLLEPEGRVIAHDALALIVRATIEEERGVETVRFSPQTASDGISRHTSERARVQGVYLFPREEPGVRLIEGTLGFPDQSGPTARARFDAFVAALRTAAPSARYEARMVDEPRKRTTYRALQPAQVPIGLSSLGFERASVSGNLEETDLAAHLLAQALAERQL